MKGWASSLCSLISLYWNVGVGSWVGSGKWEEGGSILLQGEQGTVGLKQGNNLHYSNFNVTHCIHLI